jgi:hypothetical protein
MLLEMCVLLFCHQVQAVCSDAYLEVIQGHAKYCIEMIAIQWLEF